jgi:hypothetical protein
MSGKKSIGKLHAELTASASQFVAEFKKAEAQTKTTSGTITGEIETLTKNIKKKFSLGDIGKDLLKGAGLFGGFEIARSASEAMVAQWEKAAELAKVIEASTERQLANTRSAIKASLDDRQREAYLVNEIAKTERELQGFRKEKISLDPLSMGSWQENFRAWLNDSDLTEKATQEIMTLTDALGQLGTELETVKRKRKEADKAFAQATTADLGAQMTRRLSLDAQLGQTYEGEPGHEARMAMINQLYRERALYLKQIADLPVGTNGIDGNAARAIAERNLADATAQLIPLMREEMKLGREVGQSIADSFEEAILSGNKLRDVLQSLGRDLLKIFFRNSITTPLAAGLGSFFGPLFGGPRAAGGDVSGGTSYLVGEQGPELFTPRGSGSILPAGATASAMGGGVNVYQTNHFASGVTRQEVAGLLPTMIESSKRAVLDAVSRGGGYRKAFG